MCLLGSIKLRLGPGNARATRHCGLEQDQNWREPVMEAWEMKKIAEVMYTMAITYQKD